MYPLSGLTETDIDCFIHHSPRSQIHLFIHSFLHSLIHSIVFKPLMYPRFCTNLWSKKTYPQEVKTKSKFYKVFIITWTSCYPSNLIMDSRHFFVTLVGHADMERILKAACLPRNSDKSVWVQYEVLYPDHKTLCQCELLASNSSPTVPSVWCPTLV